MEVGQHPLLWSLGFGLMLFGGSLEPALADGSSYSYKVTHSKEGMAHYGVLTVDSSGVGYSEPEDQSDNFHFSCAEFLSSASIKRNQTVSFVQMPARWRDRELRSDDDELGTNDLFQLLQEACREPQAPRTPGSLDEVSYRCLREGRPEVVSVREARVGLTGPRPSLSCHDFLIGTGIIGAMLVINAGPWPGPPVFLRALQNGPSSAEVFQGIREACATQRTRLAALQREEDAKREAAAVAERYAAAAKRKADFRDGILAALRAAEEPDPFASIRGDFDLSAADSRQWKTSLHLPEAEKCALLKTPPSTPTSVPGWTFVCRFHKVLSLDDTYEGMVKSVQSVLNVPFQPDESAVNINRVFFPDPGKPAWRVFVAKANEATVDISVAAVRSASSAHAVVSTVPSPAVPAMFVTEPTIHDEVEQIRAKNPGPMPHAVLDTVGAPAVSGRTTMTVKNSTAYELSVFFDGPVSKKLILAPGSSQDLDLDPGAFHVAGRVAAAHVRPFYGEETYAGSARYSMEFYIAH